MQEYETKLYKKKKSFFYIKYSLSFYSSEKAEANENRHSSDIAPPTKSVLKSKGKLENTISVNGDEKSLSNHVSHAGSSSKRSVTFRDGLPPGYSSNETQTPTSEKGSLKPKKVSFGQLYLDLRSVNPY